MRSLELSLPKVDLKNYLLRQLNLFFPDGNTVDESFMDSCVDQSVARLELSFDRIALPYYIKGQYSYFNHLHGDHYSAFLYMTSNTAYKLGNEDIAAKLFLLNKAMFGIDAFYGIDLPEHFLFVHPLGTVLGRANYSDFLVVYQGVTVGATVEGIYPAFSQRTILYSHSSVIGKCFLGKNFVMGANASIINTPIPDNTIVIGSYPNYRTLENKKNLITKYFQVEDVS